jgi:tetracycline repressor-like protein
MTVCFATSAAASGAHMSPVVPKPCSNTTCWALTANSRVDRYAICFNLSGFEGGKKSLGYDATSMADLRVGLGITQASLYAAFGSKEQLFREAVDLYRRTVGLSTARALAAPFYAAVLQGA